MKSTAGRVPSEKPSVMPVNSARSRRGKIMLIGADRNNVQEQRIRAAAYEVVCVANRRSALECVRRHSLLAAVILSRGSILNVLETIISLKDLCPVIKILIVLRQGAHSTDRFVRQLKEHPVQGSEIVTRRELQKRLRQEAPNGLF